MNILFIEDERELREIGVAQLESHGHTVYPVSDLAGAYKVMMNPAQPMAVKLVIADQRLPDGQGLRFIIEMKKLFPKCLYVIVSGCLTEPNIHELKQNDIPYYHKPLLYWKLVDELRREQMKSAPKVVEQAPVDEVVETEAPIRKKKWFGFGE